MPLSVTNGRVVAAERLDLNEEYLRGVLGCAFLAPDIVEAILDGRQPSDLTVKKLSRRRLPLDWEQQRAQLGFPRRELRESYLYLAPKPENSKAPNRDQVP